MMNIKMEKWAELEQKKCTQEAAEVVKGTARRIIVVKSPDPKVFEEAIFIVREDYMRSPGITQTRLLDEARQAANGYLGNMRSKRTPKTRTGLLIAISSLGGTGVAFAAMKLLGL